MSDYDVTLVTYQGIPDLTPDDQLLAAELTRRGLNVRAAVWTDASTDWSGSKLTVLRSTWDYFRRPAEFLEWIDRIEARTQLINSPSLVRWNHNKQYLDTLDARGVLTVPTVFAGRGSTITIAEAVAIFGTTELVIKPAIGGAAFGARHFALGRQFGEALTHLDALAQYGSVLIQPFLSSVLTERERSLVFLGGAFSHAYLKSPFNAGTVASEGAEVAHEPSSAELALARAALGSLTSKPIYARVDMAMFEGAPHLMELELIEPALHFHLAQGSEALFADALVLELEKSNCRPALQHAARAAQQNLCDCHVPQH